MAEEPTAEQTPPERTAVYLGNRKTIVVQDDERVPYPGKRCTTVRLRAAVNLLDAVTEITALWKHMSDADAPAWVAAEGPLAQGLITLLGIQYPGIEVRDPDPADENLPGGDG
jgi:hypothetical protein